MANSLYDYINGTMQSPWFLAGAGLVSGEGFGGAMQGMRMGMAAQDRTRQQAELDARKVAFESLLSDPSKLPQGMPMGALNIARAAGPEVGLPMLAGMIPKPKDPLDQRYKLAQIAKLQNEVAQGGRNRFGLNVQYAQNPETGAVEPFVTGHDGSVRWLDMGGKEALGPFGVAEQRKMGSERGAARANMAKSIETAGEMLSQVQGLKTDPYLQNMVGPIAGRTPDLTADSGRVVSKMDQIKGSTFLSAYERLKGGGQITEIEGKKAEEAIARLRRTQSYADYQEALGDLERVIKNGLIRARVQSGQLPQSALAQIYKMDGSGSNKRDLGGGFSLEY